MDILFIYKAVFTVLFQCMQKYTKGPVCPPLPGVAYSLLSSCFIRRFAQSSDLTGGEEATWGPFSMCASLLVCGEEPA